MLHQRQPDQEPRVETPPDPPARKGWFQRSMAWLRVQAETGRAVPILMVLTFADACISPILPEVILIPMILAAPHKAWKYAGLCSIASAVGGLFGYYIGYALWEQGLDQFFFKYVFSEAKFAELAALYGEGTFYWVFVAGLTPLPYKIFTVAAGVCHEEVDLTLFVLASISSRTLRFYLQVWAIKAYGPGVIRAMMRHSRWVTPAVLVILGALLIWWVSAGTKPAGGG